MGIIAWNIPNMITIILMAVLGYVVLAMVAQGVMLLTGQSTGSSNSPGRSAFAWMSNVRNLA